MEGGIFPLGNDPFPAKKRPLPLPADNGKR